MSKKTEVIIIGGSYAGLSAALALGRAQRDVLVIDTNNPCNRFAEYSHNFLSHDGEKPGVILKKARQDVQKYPGVRLLQAEALKADLIPNGIRVTTEGGKTYDCEKLLFATGISDILPGIAGFAECWGRSLLHCPYCHGYETRNKKLGVLANGEHAYHLVALLTNLSDDITLYTNGPLNITDEHKMILIKKKIIINEKRIEKIEHNRGQIRRLKMIDGSTSKCEALFAKVLVNQQCSLPDKLGCKITDHLISVDECQRTSVPNVYAAGDNCLLPRTISFAIAAGTRAAMNINWELTAQKLRV